MKFLPLVWRNVWRRKIRTTFTLLSIFVAFLLFGLLMTIRETFSLGVDLAGLDRLMVIHKISIIMPLPLSYQSQLRSVPGVETVTHNTWFGGVYQDPTNFFSSIATEPEPYFSMYPEIHLPPEQMKAWTADRQGAVIGVDLAKRFGWKVGDRIPLKGTIYRTKSGGDSWEFNIVGIYDGEPGVDKTGFFFRYDYLDENRQVNSGAGTVGWYVIKIRDASKSKEMAAIFDSMFANSAFETNTTTEKGFIDGFAKQIGDIGSIMIGILVAVLFTILLVVGNTMAQAVRERTSELAVLKTLGFSNAGILALVLAESMFVAVVGGGLGLAAAWAIVARGDPTGGLLSPFVLPQRDVILGIALIASVGLAAGLLPAAGAMRIRITDALRKA
jgi:putative ABC transport system permease protein